MGTTGQVLMHPHNSSFWARPQSPSLFPGHCDGQIAGKDTTNKDTFTVKAAEREPCNGLRSVVSYWAVRKNTPTLVVLNLLLFRAHSVIQKCTVHGINTFISVSQQNVWWKSWFHLTRVYWRHLAVRLSQAKLELQSKWKLNGWKACLHS